MKKAEIFFYISTGLRYVSAFISAVRVNRLLPTILSFSESPELPDMSIGNLLRVALCRRLTLKVLSSTSKAMLKCSLVMWCYSVSGSFRGEVFLCDFINVYDWRMFVYASHLQLH